MAAGADTGRAKPRWSIFRIFWQKRDPSLRIYWVDPGDMRTQMQQEAFPDEDISDRPLPEESVPGLMMLIEGDLPSGRYKARELAISKKE